MSNGLAKLYGMDNKIVVACFASVLSELEDTHSRSQRRLRGGHRTVIDELKADGHYTPEWISQEFIKVENGESRESRRIRDFVHDVGWAAELKILEKR